MIELDGSLEREPLSAPTPEGDGLFWRITEQQGTPSNENLFYSFQFLSLGRDDRARFTSDGTDPLGFERIIARVTGGSRSEILGTLQIDPRVFPSTDLFLLNPAGILFGPHATLDIPGSTFLSTADELRFDDGAGGRIVFPTGSDATPDVLATAEPVEFGFLGDDGATPASIELDLWDEAESVGAVIRPPAGTGLTLVGGDVLIHRNANEVDLAIDAGSGTVAIAAVGVGDVTVPVDVSSPDFQPRSLPAGSLGTVTIGNGARIVAPNTFVDRPLASGRVVIRAGRFELGTFTTAGVPDPTAGGELVIVNRGPNAPANSQSVDIETTETLDIRDGSQILVESEAGSAGGIRLAGGEVLVHGPGTSVVNQATLTAAGTATRLEGGVVRVADGAQVRSSSVFLGAGGDVHVEGESLEVTGGTIVASNDFIGPGGSIHVDVEETVTVGRATAPVEGFDSRPAGGIVARAAPGAVAPGGDITIRAPSISVDSAVPDGEQVDAMSLPSQISTITEAGSPTATGGDVTLETQELRLTQGGEVLALTTGAAEAGDISISAGLDGDGVTHVPARLVEARGTAFFGETMVPVQPGIFAESQAGASGDAGSVLVVAEETRLRDGGAISARAESGSTGQPGDVTVRGDLLSVVGTASGLSIESGDATDEPGGTLLLEVDRAEFLSGGFASAASSGSGDAGVIELDAREIEIAGVGSGLTARVTDNNAGDGGEVIVRVGERLVIRDGGQISSDQGANSPGLPGDVTIRGTTGSARLAMSGGGRVDISVVDPADEGTPPSQILIADLEAVTLSSGASINAQTTGSGQGGNIRIENVDVLALDSGAEITARTKGSGDGGSITIATNDFVRLDSGATISAESTGEATSAGASDGLAGQIEIDAGRELRVTGGSTIETRTAQAAGGQIRLSASDLIFLEDSLVTTSVASGGCPTAEACDGDGGDIGIPLLRDIGSAAAAAAPGGPPAPSLVVLNRSFILADAFDGNGGNILISADQLLLSDQSDIRARSQNGGIDGEIVIDAADAELAGQVVPLTTDYFDASQMMMPPCAARTSRSGSFVIQRRATPAPPPDGPLSLALLRAPEGQQCAI
ncbi:MAG: filamentous hemagglutinin N-terminal domain-containing protein [Myxococcota bacterium]|nr:filamentous hemagglutinin N-terminal domain-containing protein [Myxococcota bacterium]